MRAWCPTPGEGLVRPRTIEIVATERPLPGRNNQKSWWSCGRTSGPGRDRRARGVIESPGQAKHASSAESVGGKNARRQLFSGVSAEFDVSEGDRRLSILEIEAENQAAFGRGLASSPPAFTVASPSIYRGEATVKAGGETLLSSRSRARCPSLHPQILRKSPNNKELLRDRARAFVIWRCDPNDSLRRSSSDTRSATSSLLRSDDTEAVSAKHQACPHLAVHVHPDRTLEMGATEMGAAIGCPLVGDSTRGTETAEPLTSTPASWAARLGALSERSVP